MRRAGSVTVGAVVVLALALLFNPSPRTVYGLAGEAARGQLRSEYVRVGSVIRRIPTLSAGFQYSARETLQRNATTPATPIVLPTETTLGCANRTSDGDVRVNQDCTLRRQTDGEVAVNPTNVENLIAGQNDSSIGWNHCGFDYSLDGGQTWGSGTPPFFQRGNHPTGGHTIDGGTGTLHTYDAASDPSVAFDSRGNAYFSCVLFDINDPANGILVARSPAAAEGSFYNAVPSYSGSGKDAATNVVVEDDTVNATADEPKLAADSFVSSPYRDHVYITWTEFIAGPLCTQGGTCSSPVYFARSTNGGQMWSAPTEISGNSRKLCFNGNLFDSRRKPHDCDLDEGSQPEVLPNGDIVVVFNNSNTAGSNVNNQILAVVSRNGGTTWSRPVLVGVDVVKGQPQCDLSDGNGPEECIPGPFIRSDDDPRAAINATTGAIYAVWNDYGAGRYGIRISESTNNGATWAESVKTVDSGSVDSYMPSIGVSAANNRLFVGYYSSARVPGENKHTGLFKSGSGGAATEMTKYYLATAASILGPWSATAVSPSFEPPNGAQAGYNGDYTGMAVSGTTAYPIWSDTRNTFVSGGLALTDEDVFTR